MCLEQLEKTVEEHRTGDIGLFLSTPFTDIQIVDVYCKPRQSDKHKGYWYVIGLVDYLEKPKEMHFGGENELHKVLMQGPIWWQEH